MPAKKAAGEAAAKPVAAENKPAAEKKQQGGAGAPQKGAGAPQKTGGAPRGQGNQGQSSPSTTPKVHEISSDPKEAAIQHKLNAIDVKINKLRGDLDKISDDLAAENKSRKDLFEAQKEARNKLNNHGSSSKGAKSQRESLIGKVQELRRVRKLKQDEASKLKLTLPGQPSNEISTAIQEAYIKKIDDDIRVLERSLAGAARSLADEKKQVTEISLLRKAKQTYKDFVAVHEKIAQDSKQILDIEAELDKTKESNKNANQERNELFEKLKAIDVQIDESKKRGDEIANPRKTINEQIAKLREDSGVVRKELSEYRSKAREEANLKRQREYEERKKAREEREARYKAKQEERAKVEEAKTPYEDEIYLCDVLAKYLESLLPQKPKETSSASPAAASSTPEGVTVLKKEKEEDSINNKKDKKQKAVKITQDLKHNVEVFLQFEQISMSPPTKLADVESAITDINTKKEHFEKLSAAAVKDRQEKAAAAAAAAAAAPADKPAENGEAVASE